MLKVLIVDDDAMIGRILQRLLPQYDSVVETDPRQALARLLAGQRFDAVIADLHMPSLSGSELCVAALALTQPPRVAIVMSGDNQPDVPHGVRVIGKPFDVRALVALLDAA